MPRLTPALVEQSAPLARVLVVDDDADILESLGEILELEGYEVRRARNGVEALAALDEASVDVILLDLVMPVMNGWEFSRHLSERPPGKRAPVVVVSADRNVAQKAKEIGAAAWLGKPFELEDLLACLREVSAP